MACVTIEFFVGEYVLEVTRAVRLLHAKVRVHSEWSKTRAVFDDALSLARSSRPMRRIFHCNDFSAVQKVRRHVCSLAR